MSNLTPSNPLASMGAQIQPAFQLQARTKVGQAAHDMFNPEIATFERFPTLTSNGAAFELTSPDEVVYAMPVPYLDVILLARTMDENNRAVAQRVFYPPGQPPEKGSRPLCSSRNGITPDAGVTQRQAASCEVCPQSMKNSGTGGKGKACSYKINAAAILLLNNGDEMFVHIQVNATSAFGKTGLESAARYGLDTYINYLQKFHYRPLDVITRIERHPTEQASFRRIIFSVAGMNDPARVTAISNNAELLDNIKTVISTKPMTSARPAAALPVAPALQPVAPPVQYVPQNTIPAAPVAAPAQPINHYTPPHGTVPDYVSAPAHPNVPHPELSPYVPPSPPQYVPPPNTVTLPPSLAQTPVMHQPMATSTAIPANDGGALQDVVVPAVDPLQGIEFGSFTQPM